MGGVVIIGVLGAVATPQYQKYQKNAVKSALQQDVSTAGKAYVAYQAVNGTYCGEMSANINDDNSVGLKGFWKQAGGTSGSTTSAVSSNTSTHQNYATGGSFGFGKIGTPTCTRTGTGITGTSVNHIAAKLNVQFGTDPHDLCEITTNTFKLGAYSEVSGFSKTLWVDQDGKVTEYKNLSSEVECCLFILLLFLCYYFKF